ncbi:TPA: hypothetical protein ACIRVA_005123 [Klebsiella variicola]
MTMTTDITELAQRARINAECGEHLSPAETIELVEALEKAQQLATQQGNIACALFDEVTAQRQRIAELEEAEQQLCAANVTLDARAELAERQLADLESRTVTVKLPEPFKLAKSSSGLTYYYADEVNEALTEQGIKWEAE